MRKAETVPHAHARSGGQRTEHCSGEGDVGELGLPDFLVSGQLVTNTLVCLPSVIRPSGWFNLHDTMVGTGYTRVPVAAALKQLLCALATFGITAFRSKYPILVDSASILEAALGYGSTGYNHSKPGAQADDGFISEIVELQNVQAAEEIAMRSAMDIVVLLMVICHTTSRVCS